MGSLICRIELNKEKGKGISVTIENQDDSITQTMVFDGTSIITTCKGSSDTSVITQKQDGIEIKCKDFKLKADTISCESTGETVHKSGKKFDITSEQDMTLTSKTNIAAKADNSVEISAQKDVKATGLNVALKANSEAKIDSTSLKLSGSVSADVSATAVKIESKGLLTAKGVSTTVQGNITTIKGTAGNIVVV